MCSRFVDLVWSGQSCWALGVDAKKMQHIANKHNHNQPRMYKLNFLAPQASKANGAGIIVKAGVGWLL
jgi:hypothetical protein